MHCKTISHKPELVSGLKKATRRRRVQNNYEKGKELSSRMGGCIDEEGASSPSLENLRVGTQLEREANLFKLRSKILQRSEKDRGRSHLARDNEVEVNIQVVTMF